MSIKRYSPTINNKPYKPYAFCQGSEDGHYVAYDDHAAEVARLNEQVRALAALAEERREFIVNGVELGYIQTPTAPLDKATGTYERCLLKPKFAADAILNEVRAQSRAEGIIFAINRLLAAWESGFIDDTPEMVYDISGAILSALESLPNADEGEFKRDYADEVRARILAGKVQL